MSESLTILGLLSIWTTTVLQKIMINYFFLDNLDEGEATSLGNERNYSVRKGQLEVGQKMLHVVWFGSWTELLLRME